MNSNWAFLLLQSLKKGLIIPSFFKIVFIFYLVLFRKYKIKFLHQNCTIFTDLVTLIKTELNWIIPTIEWVMAWRLIWTKFYQVFSSFFLWKEVRKMWNWFIWFCDLNFFLCHRLLTFSAIFHSQNLWPYQVLYKSLPDVNHVSMISYTGDLRN